MSLGHMEIGLACFGVSLVSALTVVARLVFSPDVSVAVLIFAVSRSFWFSMAILVGVGIVFIMQNAVANTLLQVIVPDQLRGRLMSIYSIVLQGMQKAGGMQAGFTQALAGAPFSVAIGAIISAVYGFIVFWRWPQIRRLK